MLEHLKSDDFFSFSTFEKNLPRFKEQYENAKPFQHLVVDGLFSEAILDRAVQEFPDKNDPIWDVRQDKEIQVKHRTNWKTENDIAPCTLSLVQILNSGRFLRMVGELTGLQGLVPDPYYTGGGLNQIFRDGELAIHVDGTGSDLMNMFRRINVILFLNRDWQEEWGGHLEFWDEKKTKCEAKIKPSFNKFVLFRTNDRTPHGHPYPLNCPPEQSRKSLILYYYTATRDAQDVVYQDKHRALFTKLSDLQGSTPV